MSRIIRHSNYTEITNGLFMEIADKEFTFAEQDGVLLEESRRLSAQSRPTRFYNMSEEEIINYFDTLS